MEEVGRNFRHISQETAIFTVQTARDIDFFLSMYYDRQQSHTSIEEKIKIFKLTPVMSR
ncbi:hypothetical protein [Neglectibacter caecimuris]|uniref:hypothetical protein n=1 Tax=Neglectibacter caecimuris TaxID=3093658 RepID=UPI002AC9F00A|nr:hypothetical protein [Neglectibacter sp. M00184]